ncbi:probable polygalacturonase At3g15720 [Abrus precatorius]|uniref:Probable polygalacturonase At3g15720 n=1 Tax=Abrus precatorius TaxID=3816 RepID=A0A8B8K049_ABRPR|nr:probable polygalacturonase At3g15720 [Abrus precatorius]
MEYGACGDGKTDDSHHEGKIIAPSKDAWVSDNSSWIVMSNVNDLTIDAKRGMIDGYGSTWWQCKSCKRPRALRFHRCNGLTVNYLRTMNSPGAHISVSGCEGAKFSQINIHGPVHSPNTDGFDIASSKNILIQDSTIGTGDDCIAINGGCSNISTVGVACGPGHGISIGSLGRNQGHETVEEVHVRNCSFTGTTNGARIKTWPERSGYARKITFEQIKLTDTRNPIIIDQYYGHNISSVYSYYLSDAKAIDLRCSKLGCFGIILDQINIVSAEQGKHAYASCKNAHGIVLSSIPSVSCLLN